MQRRKLATGDDGGGLVLSGLGCCAGDDDFFIDPASGLAVVASGGGVISGQGRPGAILATWSLLGEVRAAGEEMGPSACLDLGFRRANEAVDRVTWSWRGAARPATMAAAVIHEGDRLWTGHVGTCRVFRLTPSGLRPLTTDHDLGRDARELGVAVPRRWAHLPARILGKSGRHEVTSAAVAEGDELLLTTPGVHRLLPLEDLEQLCSAGGDRTQRADRLNQRLAEEALREDGYAFALVGVEPPTGRCVATKGSRCPRRSWLFQPGTPLPEPPAGWRPDTGCAGPDERWFAEIASRVVAPAPAGGRPPPSHDPVSFQHEPPPVLSRYETPNQLQRRMDQVERFVTDHLPADSGLHFAVFPRHRDGEKALIKAHIYPVYRECLDEHEVAWQIEKALQEADEELAYDVEVQGTEAK